MSGQTSLSTPAGQSRHYGQSLVEFALVFPIVVIALLGAIDLSRAYHVFVVTTNAAREGARYGSSHPRDTAGIRGQAVAEASASGVAVTPSDPTCTRFDDNTAIPCADARNGDRVRLTVTANISFATLFVFRLSGATISNFAVMPIMTGGAP